MIALVFSIPSLYSSQVLLPSWWLGTCILGILHSILSICHVLFHVCIYGYPSFTCWSFSFRFLCGLVGVAQGQAGDAGTLYQARTCSRVLLTLTFKAKWKCARCARLDLVATARIEIACEICQQFQSNRTWSGNYTNTRVTVQKPHTHMHALHCITTLHCISCINMYIHAYVCTYTCIRMYVHNITWHNTTQHNINIR